jgi:hypothetical protein
MYIYKQRASEREWCNSTVKRERDSEVACIHIPIHTQTTVSYAQSMATHKMPYVSQTDLGRAPQNLWSYSTASAEWRDHGVLYSSPPSVSYCSMASMSDSSSVNTGTSIDAGKLWLFGGIYHTDEKDSYTQSSLVYQLVISSEEDPLWTQVNLPQAPSSRFGGNIGVVGPFVFQYSGKRARSDPPKETDSDNELHALCTFTEGLLLPKWINFPHLNNQPLSRAHYASAVVGTTIWIHGGGGGETPRSVVGDNKVAYGNHLWLLATSPEAQPSNVSCNRGFKRDPLPFGPCIDVGEDPCEC